MRATADEREELDRWRDKIRQMMGDIRAMREEMEKLEDQHTEIAVNLNWTGVEKIPKREKLSKRIYELAHGIEMTRLDLKILKEKKRRLINSVFGL